MVTPGPRRAQLGFLEVHCDPDRALQKFKRVSTSEGFTPSCRGGLGGKPQELGSVNPRISAPPVRFNMFMKGLFRCSLGSASGQTHACTFMSQSYFRSCVCCCFIFMLNSNVKIPEPKAQAAPNTLSVTLFSTPGSV